MGAFKLPRLISDGMVLQQKKKVRIWGWDEPGKKVMVSFLGEEEVAVTDTMGRWELWLRTLEPGGPYCMHISDESGMEAVLTDVWVGDVWMCSGQSNMELPMRRVKDRYPEEIRNCRNPAIRTFKITEHTDYHGPLSDHLSGEWKEVREETILDFSATAYFFAREYCQLTKVPVGLINASLGGSRIESWMSRQMLTGYDELLALADRYADDAFVAGRVRQNEQNHTEWLERLYQKDLGMQESWEQEAVDLGQWKELEVPCFFRNTSLAGFIGSVWLRRIFMVPAEFAGKEAHLWLGTMVDSDKVYVNGVLVGQTEYQYPPRKYEVPEGLLREGENTVVIRLQCENGEGRITPGKDYAIWNEYGRIDLTGTWLYRIGAECEQIAPTDFVNWKPTGLYNGMTAPCHPYTIAGVLWYQGEANAHMPECMDYADLMKRLVEGYRREWGEPDLPFFYVQLPNFQIHIYCGSKEEGDSCWAEFREQQRKALEIPGTGMVVAIDLGEDNDLHPLNKKDVGKRLALMAYSRLYGLVLECGGPRVEQVLMQNETGDEQKAASEKPFRLVLTCADCEDGLYARSGDKGAEVKDFELLNEKGERYTAKAQIRGNEILLTVSGMETKPVELRYCFDFTNKGALIYNKQGFPMSPFVMKLSGN